MAIQTHVPPLSRHKHSLFWFDPGQRYQCSGCKEEGRNGGFRCTNSSCNEFRLHPECAQLQDVLQDNIHVPEEPDFRSRSKIPRHNCTACKNTIRGFLYKVPRRRRSLTISKPSLRFHPLCITLPEFLFFTEHKGHRLKLVNNKDGDYNCQFCSRKSGGWRYDCESCGFTLDLTCAKLDMHGLLDSRSQDPAVQQQENRIDIAAVAANLVGRVATAVSVGVLADVIVNAIQ
ncbi:hypothetical protein SUGI_0957510 [Cryptomeria japonica]|nr:hypothetical protein SUGI_0957510 [Cryptomeria japonica]